MSNYNFIFNKLPTTIINCILEYDGTVYYDKGKYYNRIGKDDIRYTILSKLPKPIKLQKNMFNIYLINKETKIGYIMNYIYCSSKTIIKLNIIFNRQIDKYHYPAYTEHYFIPKTNYKWRRVLSYTELNG